MKDYVNLSASLKRPVLLPEPFLWHLFECLSIVGLLLERGEIEHNPFKDWTLIVHRDFKISNIFLGPPDKQRFCHYPTPKLGDFGRAIYVPPNAKYNDVDYFGTAENYPIETNWLITEERGEVPRPTSSKTNVWGVGNIIGSMMWKTEGVANLKYWVKEGVHEASFGELEVKHYSKELRELVLLCMRYDQDDRPSFAPVLNHIRSLRNSGLDGHLRLAGPESQSWEQYRLGPEPRETV